ncbi:MAG: GHKL domain-containing protein [Clostridia bacterium]|nr:GHKL domain-containing protein [Clostridia bacterium]
MNLMQTLMNENLTLVNIISIIFVIIQVTLFHRIFTTVLNIPTTRKKKYIFIALSSVFPIIALNISNGLLSDTLILVTFFLLLRYLFNQNIKSSILAIFITYFGVMITELVVNVVVIYILKLSPEIIEKVPLYHFLIQLLGSIILFFMPYVIKWINKLLQMLLNKFKMYSTTTLIAIFLSGIITMILETYLLSTGVGIVPLHLMLSVIISTLLYFSLSMYGLFRTNILDKTKENLENVQLYNQTLSLLHDNIRGFKHDFNNIVQAIGGYVALNDMDGLKDYYQKLLEECKISNNLNLLNPEAINNPSIYSLLTNKYFLATEKGVTMNFSIFSDLSKIHSNNYEISRIIGILLDNAIEAAAETEEKIVNIEITSDTKKNLFIIKNSFNNPDISTTQIFEKGFSTKEGNSGLGLWNVHKILSRNTNLDLYTVVEDNMFCQQFSIYYK